MASTYGTCRNCGEKLLRSDHVRFGPVLTDSDEKASGAPRRADGAQIYSWMHTPCPKCNEPRPLSRKWRGLSIVAVFVLLVTSALWLEFG